MNHQIFTLASILAALAGPAAASSIAMSRPQTQAPGALSVTSPAFAQGAFIPATYSGYGANVTPEVRWTPGPQGTRSYVLLIEDPDAPSPEPAVHWLVYDLPAEATAASRSLPNGAMTGASYRGSAAYAGPHPPAGDPPHHYHVQVFALDVRLGLRPGADRDLVVRAMAGHVLARGELVGLYQQKR